MNQLSNFGLGMLLGIIGLYGAMHYTVIQAQDGFHVVPKLSPKLETPYQDVRGYRLQNWQQNQSLALAIVRSDKGYLLNDPTLVSFRENVQSVLTKYSFKQPSVQSTLATYPVPQ